MTEDDERRSSQDIAAGQRPGVMVPGIAAADPAPPLALEAIEGAAEPAPAAAGEARPDTPADAHPAMGSDDRDGSFAADISHSTPSDGSPFAGAVGPSPAATQRSAWGPVPALLGVMVLILLAALAYLLFAGPDASRVASLESEVDGLKAKVAALDAKVAVPSGVAALAQRLDGMEGKLAALTTALAAVGAKVEAVPAPTDPGQVAGLAAQVASLDGKLSGLGQDLETLRATVGALPKPDTTAIEARLGAVDGRLAALEAKTGTLPDEIAAIKTRLDGLDDRLKPVEAATAAAASPQRVAVARAAPLAVTAQSVTRAIDSGAPFDGDVKVLASLGADAQLLQPLQAVAGDGAPSLKDLRADLAGLRDRILAGSTPGPSGSYLDRLMAGASSLVRVRPLGSVVGDSPGAILARMDEDLGADRLDASLAEWQKLPDAARAVSKGLAERIRLRAAAERAASRIAADAVGAMTAKP